ncbi:sigma factor-like helix-turn-helix DNA-binding protein [Archangium lansingense]|uniref:sigma factor-like helix-turn-helix DNA-binding protein n=1 Tax=Archangium lansingense TaxID=2995310 RepID=UPI003B786BD1
MSDEQDETCLSAFLPHAQRIRLGQVDGLETSLRKHLDAGQAAWPSVVLAPERFIPYLALQVPEEDAARWLHQLHGADLYLARACLDGAPEALRTFDQQVLRKVPARLGPGAAAQTDEILQMLRERLLVGRGDEGQPKLAFYAGRGPLLAWVRIAAERILIALHKREGHQERFEELPEETLSRFLCPEDPERLLTTEDARQALTDALRRATAALAEQERSLLRLHHVHGFTMDRLAKMFGEPRSSVAYRVARARERLLRLIRAELTCRLGLGESELESFLGLIRSQWDVSLQRWM